VCSRGLPYFGLAFVVTAPEEDRAPEYRSGWQPAEDEWTRPERHILVGDAAPVPNLEDVSAAVADKFGNLKLSDNVSGRFHAFAPVGSQVSRGEGTL
jgi:hypothetical protein